jgi:tetrahydromethanopterin S-methyltransferase subunit A
MTNAIFQIEQELAAGIELSKCRKCGCMQDMLRSLSAVLPQMHLPAATDLHHRLAVWSGKMNATRYACRGCQHCYPAVAHNLFAAAFPHIELPSAGCSFQVDAATWPPVSGEYVVLSATAPVAVSTLANVALADQLAARRPVGLAIVGKTETENIGIDKIIKNSISNPALRFLIVCGIDSKGHQTGQTLLSLAQNGVDASRRVIEADGKRPVLQNVTGNEIEQFRAQMQVIDMIGCTNVDDIGARIAALAAEPAADCSCDCCCDDSTTNKNTPQKITATDPDIAIKLDKAGYFVVLPLPQKGLINVEHYSYDHTLLRIIEGETARALYLTIVENGWVTELNHAAYLGKELAKAELSLQHGLKYTQDGA